MFRRPRVQIGVDEVHAVIRKHRNRVGWTEVEEAALKTGVSKYGEVGTTWKMYETPTRTTGAALKAPPQPPPCV